jgi:hypothetical protein
MNNADMIFCRFRRLGQTQKSLSGEVPRAVQRNVVVSYIPSGCFEKIVKKNPPLLSSWDELDIYFRKNYA